MWRIAAHTLRNALVCKADASLPNAAPTTAAGNTTTPTEPAAKADELSSAIIGATQQPNGQAAANLAPFSILSILSSIARGDDVQPASTTSSIAASWQASSTFTSKPEQKDAAAAAADAEVVPGPSKAAQVQQLPAGTDSEKTHDVPGSLTSSAPAEPQLGPASPSPDSLQPVGSTTSTVGGSDQQQLSGTNTSLELLYRLNARSSTTAAQHADIDISSSRSSDGAGSNAGSAPTAAVSGADATHTAAGNKPPAEQQPTMPQAASGDAGNSSTVPEGVPALPAEQHAAPSPPPSTPPPPPPPQQAPHQPSSHKQSPTSELGISSMADELLHELGDKPCTSRACTSTKDLFASFQSQFGRRKPSNNSNGGSNSSSDSTGTAGANGSVAAATAAAPAAAAGAAQSSSTDTAPPATNASSIDSTSSNSSSSNSNSSGRSSSGEEARRFWESEEEMPCPPDITELGRALWTFLHTAAAYYPDQPTPAQQAHMQALMAAIGELYPCPNCAQHLRKELATRPPEVASAQQLSKWMCDLHNGVNVHLGKETFDCSKVFERWRDGPTDGSCGGPAFEH